MSRLWLVFILLAYATGVVAQARLEKSDFAEAIELELAERAPVHELALPMVVYERAARADLGDIRIFNADGESVPHSVPKLPLDEPAKHAQALPLFPLADAKARLPHNVRLRIERGERSQRIELDTVAPGQVRHDVAAYIVDAAALGRPANALTLDWRSDEKGFVATVDVFSSDDLETWQAVKLGAKVLDLKRDTHVLSQRRIVFDATDAKYFKLVFDQAGNAPRLSAVSAGWDEQIAPLAWQPVTVSSELDTKRRYLFTVPRALAVTQLRVRAPQTNTLVEVEVLSRAQISDAWQPVGSTLVYRLEYASGEIENPPLALANSRGHYFAVEVDAANGGFGAQPPQVSVAWQPHLLAFAARGDGPFLLAYGSAKAARAGVDVHKLLKVAKRSGDTGAGTFGLPRVRFGEPIMLAGDEALRAPIDWKRWVLWSALSAGVLLVLWMSARLARQVAGSG